MPKIFLRETICAIFRKNSCSESVHAKRRGRVESLKIFRGKFLSQSADNFSYRKLSALCFEKFPVAKAFMDQKVGRVSKFSVENF